MHYCGVCKTMGTEYGQRSRWLLNHDAVFLAELLTSLGGRDVEAWGSAYQSWNCMKMPRGAEMPEVLRYAAASTVLLSECRLDDHDADSGGARKWRWARRWLSSSFRKARRELAGFGFDLQECDRILGQQAGIEKAGDPEAFPGPTAEATALVFAEGARIAELTSDGFFREVGYRFGRLIYWLDAWEDYEKDARSRSFNGLRSGGLSLEWGARKIREDVEGLVAILPAEFGARLVENVEARLGSLKVLHSCVGSKRTMGQRWNEALARARTWNTPAWKVVAVATVAFLFPMHARHVRSSGECLSLGFNLMALGGLLASAQAPLNLKPKKAGGSWLSGCDCDDCGCCDSLDCCSGCDCSC
jgi:hypothetical protein